MTHNAIAPHRPISTHHIINKLKSADQDFEWYPTTQEMIDLVKADLSSHFRHDNFSVLDCGAGDGRVLNELTKGERYAIEKSDVLLSILDKNIYVVGTDLHEQTLIDKKTDVLFSNPPYLEFIQWMKKIITEANAALVYMIVPTRWKENKEIADLLTARKAKTEILGTLDFLSGDRQARAVVDVIKVKLGSIRGSYTYLDVEPFDLFFNQNFKIEIENTAPSRHSFRGKESKFDDEIKHELVSGNDIISILLQFYNRDLDALLNNYKAIEQVNPALLFELGVSLDSIKKGIKMKIEGLKDIYWKKFLDNMRKITDRLCADTRQRMLDRFMKHVHVDFTASNAYAVVIWALKYANDYFDSQLVEFVRGITCQNNVIHYKSNQNTIQGEMWRYLHDERKYECKGAYKLDYRFIVHTHGGIHGSGKGSNLCDSTTNRINDMLTVAYNLGFDISEALNAQSRYWESNHAQYFHFKDRDGQMVELAKVRAFKNGNIHFSLNQKFLCRLNVEFGRLMGWVKSAKEAADEMDIAVEDALDSFNANVRLSYHNVMQLNDLSRETENNSTILAA